jgi:hypothetical protein
LEGRPWTAWGSVRPEDASRSRGNALAVGCNAFGLLRRTAMLPRGAASRWKFHAELSWLF